MKNIFLQILLILEVSVAFAALPPINTREILGQVGNVQIEIVVQSPSAEETPLQIVCLFEYVEGDITSPPALPKEMNGIVHVDEALHGLITDLRKTNKFKGKFLETLLITPPPQTILAKKLLLIGLGNRNNFNPEIMKMIGIIGMREALRLSVTSYAHASDLKDAGIASPTAEVAANVILGAIEAYNTQKYLKEQNASNDLSVTKVSLLTGPAYFEDSKEGIKKIINLKKIQ